MNNEVNSFNNDLENISNKEKNTIGLVGFILSFFIPLVGLILSIVGLNKSKKLNGENKGLSIAGIILSSLGLVVSVMLLAPFILKTGLFTKPISKLTNGFEDVTEIIQNAGDDVIEEDEIKVKVVTGSSFKEQTFNGITVKVEKIDTEYPGANVYVNGKLALTVGDSLIKYAFMGESIVFLHCDTSWNYLSIYNTETEKITFETVNQKNHLITSVPDYLWPDDFRIGEGELYIDFTNHIPMVVPNGWDQSMCQMNNENIHINVYKSVTYEMEYLGNGNFGLLEEENGIYMSPAELKNILCS